MFNEVANSVQDCVGDTVASGSNLSSSDVIAACGVVIAICAIVLTVYQTILSRRHNRLSVKPRCFSQVDRENGLVTVQIVNGGLGPALVSNVQIQFLPPGEKEHFYIVPEHLETWPKEFGLQYVRHTDIDEDGRIPIPAGEKVCVYEVKVPGDNKAAEDQAKRITGPLQLSVFAEYEDMYGNRYPDDKKKPIKGV